MIISRISDTRQSPVMLYYVPLIGVTAMGTTTCLQTFLYVTENNIASTKSVIIALINEQRRVQNKTKQDQRNGLKHETRVLWESHRSDIHFKEAPKICVSGMHLYAFKNDE